jgi:hypothetical protein
MVRIIAFIVSRDFLFYRKTIFFQFSYPIPTDYFKIL